MAPLCPVMFWVFSPLGLLKHQRSTFEQNNPLTVNTFFICYINVILLIINYIISMQAQIDFFAMHGFIFTILVGSIHKAKLLGTF